MFTGIVRGIGRIAHIATSPGLKHFTIEIPSTFLSGIEIGASIAVDGTCLTVVKFTETQVSFDLIGETLARTTLGSLKEGDWVNMERSARVGDEIGGHLLSGHVCDRVTISAIEQKERNYILTLSCAPQWAKYLFPKGFVALNGASLTLVDVDQPSATFTVHLIPETLEKTTFGRKKVGDDINLEIDSQTQAIVDTLLQINNLKIPMK
jgi:riboflavin synthase